MCCPLELFVPRTLCLLWPYVPETFCPVGRFDLERFFCAPGIWLQLILRSRLWLYCTVIAGRQLFIDACLLYNDDSLVADRTGPLPSRNKPLWGSPAGYSAIDWSLLFVHTVQWQILGSLSKKSDPLADQSEAYVWVILPPRTQPTMYGTEGSISPKPYRRVKKISLLIFTPSSILPTSHE